MLTKIKLSQFGGINTILDSTNAGVSEVREAKNFLLRPLGGLGVPAAFSSFNPGGTILDLGFFVDFYFPEGSRLIMQASGGQYFHIVPDVDGRLYGVPIADPVASPQTEDLVVGLDENIGIDSDSGIIGIFSDKTHGGVYFQNVGFITFRQTRFEGDIVFTIASGKSILMDDSNGNTWRLSINDTGEIVSTTV